MIFPSESNDLAVQRIVDVMSTAVKKLIPEAEVLGFATGDAALTKICNPDQIGPSVPEVEVIVQCSPDALLGWLQAQLLRGRIPGSDSSKDMRKLQKSASPARIA